MAHQLPSHLSDPRPELNLCGHMEIDGQVFFLYDLSGAYLPTTEGGSNLGTDDDFEFASSLSEAMEMVSTHLKGYGL